MRELFFKLFAKSYFNTGISITAFSLSHIVWLSIIIGTIILLYCLFAKKEDSKKEKLLRILAYVFTLSYFSDFFVHDFVYGGLEMDKLPFHICTVLCPLACVAQFNRNGKKILEPVVILSILAPLMYLSYPASVGDGEPWCYQAVQTMFYHGTLFAWGVLNVAFGKLNPDIKKCYKSGILLVIITLWAKFGNILLEHNWFFLEEDAFYIGLVANGVLPKWSLMIINPIVFFLAVLATYGVIYGVKAVIKKAKNK